VRPADRRPADSRLTAPLALGLVVLLSIVGGCRKEGTTGPLLPAEYNTWARTTERVLDYPIPGHEDRYRRIFINALGGEVTVSTTERRVSWEYPTGTTIVKEIFAGAAVQADEGPVMLTGMIKAPGNPRARGGWLWVVRDLTSGSEQIVDWEFCVDCHANANEPHPYGDRNEGNEFRDYVFFPYRAP
jgi:hypothetical protein